VFIVVLQPRFTAPSSQYSIIGDGEGGVCVSHRPTCNLIRELIVLSIALSDSPAYLFNIRFADFEQSLTR
jgi:hypothetical protein